MEMLTESVSVTFFRMMRTVAGSLLMIGGGSTPFCCAEARVVKASSAHANRILKYVFIVWIFILKEVTTQNFTAPRGVNRFAMLYQTNFTNLYV